MSECRRTTDRLTPFVDDALPAEERAAVEQHLDACPPCRVTAAEEQGGRTVLRERAEQLRSQPLPPGLRSRCAALARDGGRTGAPSWHSRLIPAALTAVLVLFTAFAAFMLATQRSNTLLAAQLTTDHERCFRRIGTPAAELNGVAEENRLATSYGWDIHVPPSSPANDIRLVGARKCLYSHGGIPHLLYEVGGQPVSLYIFEGVARNAGDLTTLGHRARIWSRGATTFVLVSPESAGDLPQALAYVRQEAH